MTAPQGVSIVEEIIEQIPVQRPFTSLVPRVPSTPMDIVRHAVENGASIEVLEKLMALQERHDANMARKAFDEAIAAAKANIKIVPKSRTVDFTSQKGRTNYRYEDLADIAKAIDGPLSAQGLSYRFRTSSLPNEPVTVTCIISHRDGHCEENTLSAGRDESGNKNSIQSIGSTITYLQRYTLKAALGLAASIDDDGKDSGGDDNPMTDEQLAEVTRLITTTKSNVALFCKAMKVECLSDIPAKRYDDAIAKLKAKEAKQAAEMPQ